MSVGLSAGQAESWPRGRMTALCFAGPGRLASIDVEVPGPSSGQILARVTHVGICGTDVHLMSGHSTNVRDGLTAYPIRFGHEWVGEVVAVAPDVDEGLLSRTVVGEPFLSCGQCGTCRAGHYNLCPSRSEMGVLGTVAGAAAEYLRVPATNVAVVPDSIPAQHALLAEPSVTVLHAFEVARVQPGERVAVLGTGTIGLIAVQVGASMGCHLEAVGRSETGRRAALAAGASAAHGPQDTPAAAFDVIIDATGSSSTGPLLTEMADVSARVVMLGIPPGPSDGIDLAAFVNRGLSLCGVLGGVHLLERALALISSGTIKPAQLIDDVLPATEAAAALARARASGRARPKVILDMSTLPNASFQPTEVSR